MLKDSDKDGNITRKAFYIIASFIVNSLPFISVLVICGFILPGYINIFKASGVELPVIARTLFQLSNFIVGYWFLYIIASIFLILVLTGLFSIFYINEWVSKTIILVTNIVLSVGISLLIILLFCFVVYIPLMDIKHAISLLI